MTKGNILEIYNYTHLIKEYNFSYFILIGLFIFEMFPIGTFHARLAL